MENQLPLRGVRVVSIAVNLPGPAAAARLTALGAEVITVLPPEGDPLQHYAKSYFDELHAGQELRTINLKSEQGQNEMAELLQQADVFITSSRPSALKRLGLDFDSVHVRNGQVCQIDIVGYPGEQADIAGHDLTYQAVAGLVADGKMPRTTMIDLCGAERAAGEACAALVAREQLGTGMRREVALSELAVSMSGPLRAGLTGPGQLLGGGLPVYAIYEAAQGKVAVAALEPHFTQRLLAVLELEAKDCTHERIAEVLATRTAEEWTALAKENDVPLVAVAGQPDVH